MFLWNIINPISIDLRFDNSTFLYTKLSNHKLWIKIHPFICKNIMNKIYFWVNLIKKDLRLKVEYRFFDSFPSKLKNNIEWKEKERKYFFIQLTDGIIYHWMVKMDGSFDQRLNESSCILTKRTRLYFRCYHFYLPTSHCV